LKLCSKKIETVDIIVCAAGESRFAPLGKASDDDFAVSINSKLMGQVNLVRIGWIGCRYVAVQGSITLTSGLLAREPWPGAVPTAMVNVALYGFVRAAALDIENSIRINVVSPVFVTETAKAMGEVKKWRLQEMVPKHPFRDPPIGLPVRCASTLSFCRQTTRRVRPAPASPLNRAHAPTGTVIPWGKP
jgi:NADP-dependent 3-hydroxy acid dehydrogenase YdfG